MHLFVPWMCILLVACAGGADVEGFGHGRVVGVGSAHSCVVPRDGVLRCWGANGSGQLGDGSRLDQARPVKVGESMGSAVWALAMGYAHTCAINGDHALFCWGDNGFGQLGLGDGFSSGRTSPTRVDVGGGRTVVAVAAGYAHTCAIVSDRSLVCWGFNGSGQLGNGDREERTFPVAVDLGDGAHPQGITAGFSHTCVLLGDRSVRCWGGNGMGQVGDGSGEDRLTPVEVDLGWGVWALDVRAGDSHTCALVGSGTLKCWGSNQSGQLGDSGHGEHLDPVGVEWGGEGDAAGIALGKDYTCGVGSDGILFCWGGNGYGQLGDGSTRSRPTPEWVDLGEGRKILSVFGGESHLCAWLSDHSPVCWGSNSRGQLGGDVVGVESGPVAGVGFLEVVTGNVHSCALGEAGSVRCWGGNNFGQLGDGTGVDRHAPVAVTLPSGRSAKKIAAGCDHTCGILDDDSLACWGKNIFGQLGDGGFGDQPVPRMVPLDGVTGVWELEVGCEHTCVVLEDNSRKCWGEPTLEMRREAFHYCQIRENSRVSCRGSNGRGQLGRKTIHRGDDPGEMGDNLPAVTIF